MKHMNPNDLIGCRIALLAIDGKYVRYIAARHYGSYLDAKQEAVGRELASEEGDWATTFVIERHPSYPDGYALRSHWGYVCAINGGGSTVEANCKEAKEWECFYISRVEN